jgi:AcrR family transcriptional regulator
VGPLPRGHHDLTPEEVERHQRERILAAAVKEMARSGYGDLTVARVISRARVSRTTFYAQFANKREVVAAAHQASADRFLAVLEGACDTELAWPLKVKAGIEAILEFARAEPEQAQLLAVGLDAADVVLGERARVSQARLLELLGEGRRHPPAAPLPGITEEALVGAISMVLSGALVNGPEDYATLRRQLVEFILTFYLGTAEAAKVADS